VKTVKIFELLSDWAVKSPDGLLSGINEKNIHALSETLKEKNFNDNDIREIISSVINWEPSINEKK
jgi:hypothetical protein